MARAEEPDLLAWFGISVHPKALLPWLQLQPKVRARFAGVSTAARTPPCVFMRGRGALCVATEEGQEAGNTTDSSKH